MYLKKEDDVPDESQDNGGVSIGNVSRINTDQLNLVECTWHECVQPIQSQVLPVLLLTFRSSRKDRTLAMLLSRKIR